VPGALANRTVPEIRPTFLTEQPGPDSTVMRTFHSEARIGVCETSSVCSSGSSRRDSLRRSSPASRSFVQSGAPP
jgi:hypothetical protein